MSIIDVRADRAAHAILVQDFGDVTSDAILRRIHGALVRAWFAGEEYGSDFTVGPDILSERRRHPSMTDGERQ